MKNLKSMWVLFAAMVVGCNQDAEISEKENKSLSGSGTTQVNIGEELGDVLSITYSNMTFLENELKTYWGLTSLNNLRLGFEGGEYWLKADGNNSSGEHIDWALLMDKQLDDIVMLIDGGGHTCTSRACCRSCKLTIASATDGYCSCKLKITYGNGCGGADNADKRTCGHSVSTGLGSDSDHVDMVNTLAAGV